MNNYRSGAMAALPVVLFLATITAAQSFSGNTIMGKVRTQSGRPVPNLMVELQTGNGITITQAVTTNEGDYAFTGLEGASFILMVSDPGYEAFSERVELTRIATTRPGETVRVDITLSSKKSPRTPEAQAVFRQDVPPPALQAYRRGAKLLAEGKSEEGLDSLREAIKLFPEYFDAHLASGLEMYRLRRFDESIRELELARSINPRDSRTYHTFGLVLIGQKKYAIAARVFEEAALLDPTRAESRLMRGAALIEIGRLDEAEGEIKRAGQISGNKLAVVHLQLARVYEKRGERARAADELEAYLNKNPADSNAVAIRDAIKKLREPKG